MPDTTTLYWCELAWLGGDTVTPGVTIEVTGDRITKVITGPAATEAVRLAGLTVPAFANAHSHAFHRALRGRTHSGRGSFWTWRDLMYRVASRLNPDNYYDLARATYAEMLMAGIGVVGEFHYVHHHPDGTPYADPNAMGQALIAAATDVGLRITLLDTLYLHGGFGFGGSAEHYAAPHADQIRFSDGSAEAWTRRVSDLTQNDWGPAVRIGAALHSVRAVDPASMAAVNAWCEIHDVPLHVHVSEQPAENEQCIEHLGSTPISLLDDSGSLSANTTLVHATHLSDDDVARTARSHAWCCFCPTTERDLADGIGPSQALSDAGVGLCLGTDSHALIDMFEETRAVELNQRLETNERGVHPTAELAELATTSGYRSLGWAEGGRLVAGGLADFTTVGLDSVRLAGTDPTVALESVIFAATADDVQHVVVGGRAVIVKGRHGDVNVAEALAASIEKVVPR